MCLPLRAAVLFLATTAMSCPQPLGIVEAMDFQRLEPPSTMFAPGAVLALEPTAETRRDDNAPVRYKICCGPRASLGENLVPTVSKTIAQTSRQLSATQWKLSGTMLERAQASVGGDQVESVTARLVNAKILSLSDADVMEGLADRSPECARAIKARLEQGYELVMVNAALVADLDFNIEWKSTISVDKKARLRDAQRVAASLGGGQQRVGLKSVESRGLVLGIRTDPFLLALSVPDMPAQESMRKRDAVGGPPPRHAIADAQPDAEFVSPPGGIMQPAYSFDE